MMIAAFTRFDVSNVLTSPGRVIGPLAFVIVIGIVSPFPLLAIPAAAAVTTLAAGTPFLNDERGHLGILYGILPITRTTVVVGRYLQMVLWFVVAVILGIGTTVVTTAVRGDSVQFSVVALAVGLSFFSAAFALAVQLPVFFAFGFARARAAMYIPVIVLAVLWSVAAGLGPVASDAVVQAVLNPITPALAVVFGVVALVVSTVIAARIYAKRQF